MSAAIDLTIPRLVPEEGERGMPYNDSKGIPTIGIGTKLPLDDEEMRWLAAHRLENVEKSLSSYDFYNNLNDARKSVMLDLAFNMGVGGLLHFVEMIAALRAADYAAASAHLLDSKWRTDVGDRRALPLAKILKEGTI